MIPRIRPAVVRALLPSIVLAALFCRLAIAADSVPQGKLAVLQLDPAKTTIAYSLEGWPHHTQGTFALKHGVIRLYPRTGKMDGIIIVDAASGNSGHSVRDDRMKSSVLEVSRFPDNVGHILGSRSLRGHRSLAGRLSYWANEGASHLKKLVSRPEKSSA